MIFDLVGISHSNNRGGNKSRPLGDLFSNEIYLRSQSLYRKDHLTGANFNCTLLHRPDSFKAWTHIENEALIIIGETFLSARGQSVTGLAPQRLGAETIHDLVKRYPENWITMVKGNFQVIRFDDRSETTVVHNSRFGVSPFYYAVQSFGCVFGTSLSEIRKVLEDAVSIDVVAVAEHALFNYPLLDRTFYSQVKALQTGETITFDSRGLRKTKYWDAGRLFHSVRLNEDEALEGGSNLFRETVNVLAADLDRVAVSLTAGFDGRANLAALERPGDSILCYAFGIPESENLSIPQDLCRKLGLPFEAILLDESYEKVFDRYADTALLLSDGLSTVERANYPYAFERLSRWSPVVITGIFGSELMRTFQNVGLMVNQTFADLNAAEPVRRPDIVRAVLPRLRYFDQVFLKNHLPEVIADVERMFGDCAGLESAGERFYYFLLTHALRKYFGAEVHMERLFATNRFPYLDDDFVEFIFRSPFAGVRGDLLRPTPRQRFRSQYFYAHVMKRYRPALLGATTDHGFSPSDLLKPFPLFWIGPKFLFRRQVRKWRNYREFKTEEWTAAYYQKKASDLNISSPIFSTTVLDDLSGSTWLQQRTEFAKAASLKLWLNMVNGV